MTVKTTRNLVLLIRSLVLYWLGHVKEKIKDAVADAWQSGLYSPTSLDPFFYLQVASYEEDSAREMMNDWMAR